MLITEDYLNKTGRKIYLYLQKGNQWKFGHEITKQSAKIGTGTSKEKNGTGRFLNQYKMVCSIIFLEWVRHIFAFSDSLTSCQPTMSPVACRVYSPKVYHTSGPWKMVVGRLYTFLLGRSFFRGCASLGECILWTGFPFHCTNIITFLSAHSELFFLATDMGICIHECISSPNPVGNYPAISLLFISCIVIMY